ncbi:MAG TPA: hypothetical protein VME47_12810 [Acetobacteraceae bacterium]|nr:hypothetical protein [Acetobacteraceae bacterium]
MTPNTDTAAVAPSRAPNRLNVKLQDESGIRYLDRQELCEMFNISLSTAERWARIKYGPRPVKIGPRRIGYKLADVLAFSETRQAAAA